MFERGTDVVVLYRGSSPNQSLFFALKKSVPFEVGPLTLPLPKFGAPRPIQVLLFTPLGAKCF